MKNALVRVLALLTLAASPVLAAPAPAAPLDTVVFGGGCFWGVQAVFQHVNGVVSATSGYAGGNVPQPSYEDVSTGRTGHVEVVRVVYDPAKVSFTKLLDVFFSVAHDPTQLNRQGPDHGTQYRSALYYTDDAQHAAASKYVVELQKSLKDKVVTQVSQLRAFYTAEAYHQNYATLHPDQPYIAYNDTPKIEALKRQFAALWTDKLAAY